MRIVQGVLDAIVEHTRREGARECCGLLIGTGTLIVEAVPCANRAAEPERAYVIAPEDYFAQIRRCRQHGNEMAVVGAYHSHPRGRPVPSPTDLAGAFSEFLYVIAGQINPDVAPDVRGYTLTDGNLRPVDLVPDAQETNP